MPDETKIETKAQCDGSGCGHPCTVCGADYGSACDGEEDPHSRVRCPNSDRRCSCVMLRGEVKTEITPVGVMHTIPTFPPAPGDPAINPAAWFLVKQAARDPYAPPAPEPAPYENKGQHWIQSYTGKAIDVFDLQADQIDLLDIAHALSNLCRYTGHVREFYSVAVHSLAVMKLTELMGHGADMQLWALLHDAGEAYMADVAAPLKRHPIFEGYRALEAENDRRIRARFGINLEDSQLTLIRTFDMAMSTPEREKFMTKPPRAWGVFPIIEAATEALEWAWARRRFAEMLYCSNFHTLNAKIEVMRSARDCGCIGVHSCGMEG